MAEIRRFCDSYDIVVCKRQDIIDCLDENITDKELVMEVISDCELRLTEHVKNGDWATLPFIGGYRWSEMQKRIDSPENVELIQAAKETLPNSQYLEFRKQLLFDTANIVKKERVRAAITAQYRTKNKEYWYCIAKRPQLANCINKEVVVRFICGTFMDIEPTYTTVLNDYEYIY